MRRDGRYTKQIGEGHRREGGAHNPPETFCQVWSGTGGYGNGEFIAQGDLFTDSCVVSFPDSPPDQAFCISRDDFTNKRGEEIWAFNVLASDRGAGVSAGLHYVEGGTGRFEGVHGVLYITLKRCRKVRSAVNCAGSAMTSRNLKSMPKAMKSPHFPHCWRCST